MNSIIDKEKNIVAYFHNLMIIDAIEENVIGIVIGDCIFGSSKEPVGKLFNNTFWHLNGEKMALLEEEILHIETIKLNEKTLIIDAWEILNNIQNHTCKWIVEKNNWHQNEFLFLLQYEK